MELFSIEGITQEGKKYAFTLGYPTANIPCLPDTPSGIYAGEVIWNGTVYPAALYKEDGKNFIEAHILDFSGDLYGEKLTVIAREKIRDVKKFPTEAELMLAIEKDIKDIKENVHRNN